MVYEKVKKVVVIKNKLYIKEKLDLFVFVIYKLYYFLLSYREIML